MQGHKYKIQNIHAECHNYTDCLELLLAHL